MHSKPMDAWWVLRFKSLMFESIRIGASRMVEERTWTTLKHYIHIVWYYGKLPEWTNQCTQLLIIYIRNRDVHF